MTGWHACGMLVFHPYRWNQLKVIPLACTARTESVLSNATSHMICDGIELSAIYVTEEEVNEHPYG